MSKTFFDIMEENKLDNQKPPGLPQGERGGSVRGASELRGCAETYELKRIEKVTKSVRGMPWLSEAKKDVISCDKLRGGANNP